MFGTSTAILLLIVFLVPGYVWRTTEGQFVYLKAGEIATIELINYADAEDQNDAEGN